MSNVAFGRDIVFGCAQESSYNEAWGTPTLNGIYISPNVSIKPNRDIMREIHATGLPVLKSSEIKQGVKNYTLGISGKLPKEGLSWLLLNLCGKVATNLYTSTYYGHDFYLSNKTPKSLKLVLQNPIIGTSPSDFEWQLTGAMIKSVEFTFEVNQPSKFANEFAGGIWYIAKFQSSVNIPVASSGNPFWWFKNSWAKVL